MIICGGQFKAVYNLQNLEYNQEIMKCPYGKENFMNKISYKFLYLIIWF